MFHSLKVIGGRGGARAVRMSSAAVAGSTGKHRVLVTGSLGQIGSELVGLLRAKHGADNVVATDVRKASGSLADEGIFKYADVTDYAGLEKLVVDHSITMIVNMAGVLSAAAEKNVELAVAVNSHGQENVIRLARTHSLRLLTPSSIAAFGPSTPRDNTPNMPVMDPNTIYGVAKLQGELLGRWAMLAHNVDYRSMRLPGIVSYLTAPGGGTTDWAPAMILSALTSKQYECFVSPTTTMPMLYMPDALDGIMTLLHEPRNSLTSHVYNMGGFSFSPAELAEVLETRIPGFVCTYKEDFRAAIAKSWPKSLDSSLAENDWGWKPSFLLEDMVDDMLENLEKRLTVKGVSRSSGTS